MEFCSGSVSLFHKRRHATTAAFRSTSGTIILNSAHVYLFVGVNVRVYLSLCARARVCVCRSVCESPVGSTSCAKPGRAGNSSVLLPRPLIYPLIVIFGRDTFRTYLQMCMNEEAVCSFVGLCGRFGVWGGLFGSAVKILKESTDSRVFCASRSQPDCSLAWTS